jgi:exonuclease SbcD
MRRIRADVAGRPGDTPSIVLAHAFVTGGEASESERDISVGGAVHVPAGVFDGVDYVALGHLHGCQTMTERVRYSGSPLAYSFSEERQRKGCWLVDLRHGGVSAEFAEAPVPRRIARLRGRIDELLNSGLYEKYEQCWLQITLTDPERPTGAMERLRRRFPYALVLGFEPEGTSAAEDRTWSERISGRAEQDLARDFITEVTGAPVDDAERALLDEAFQRCRIKESAT